ncbi:uncharacterized protein LOC126376952 [Pectinophora gossypiella]|uniref:uncharacterized protein LOC126376952 n=1 Tax=Pectinophora gossypiella TaxID=13191 RepID=UPI00214E5DC4|nr:uncharacterized protein LOC126376952 [Pectinophora gossypiella]
MKSLFCVFGAFLQLLIDVQAIEVATQLPEKVGKLVNQARRIMNGEPVTDNRPYMVYLKLPRSSAKSQSYRKWLCGGVIIHDEYVLTSAACIQDVEHFYVVSGTYKYADEDDRYNNPCIKNGGKKAIWKCVPKNYIFDGHENDNIRWMNNDIAVVKIEDGFDFTRRVRGCEFVPKPVCYNNQSQTLENPGTIASIAGWGTTERYNDWVNRRGLSPLRRTDNQQNLLEAAVEIIAKNRCKRRWGSRYHNIIDNYMICTKDIGQTMSEICNEKYVDCQDINYSDEEDGGMRRDANALKRTDKVPTNLIMHSALHNETFKNGSRRFTHNVDGGFCENDHGGPLVYGSGINSVVIGVISACLVKERTNKCYGPFLYTSIYKNRQFISCSIFKDVEPKCRRQFRSGVTHEETVLSWKNHEDGPAKFEQEPAAVPEKKVEAVAVPAPVVPAVPQPPVVAAVPEVVEPAAPEPVQAETAQVVQRAHEEAAAAVPDKVYANSGFVIRGVNETKVAKANATHVADTTVCKPDIVPAVAATAPSVVTSQVEISTANPEPTSNAPTGAAVARNDKKEEDKKQDNKKHDDKKDDEEGDGIRDEGWEYENSTYVDTRRILYSKTVGVGKRPYMVYLQLTKESAKAHKYRGWLCGGVIVDRNYVLTSAACVEDADRFYIVSGTIKFVDSFDFKSNDCVCKHRRKVVWKCIPKNYKFDFQDSIKWSSNDIAIVKVDRPFKLGVQEKGCEFATDLICYNNISRELEKPGTKAFIAGWGSGSNFREGVYRRQKVHIPENAKCLQEAKVCIMDNEQCAKKWAQRFRTIITQYMICTKDVMKRLSEICEKKYANCTDVESRRIFTSEGSTDVSGKVFNVDLGRHLRDPDDYTARRSSMQGGFCENDHGGPLIVKYQNKERVIGVISACKIDPKSHSCHGPFLYTSVFKNRQFISCAINKDVDENCRRVFRTGITHEEWSVNWDDYNEDGEDSPTNKAEDKDDDDNEEVKEKPALRNKTIPIENNRDEDKKEEVVAKKESASTKAEKKEDSSEEEGKDKAAERKDSKEEKKEKAEKADKKEEKAAKKPKSKKNKKHSKKKAKASSRAESKEANKKDDTKPKVDSKGEVFYESSRDENVNDPEE